MDSFIQTPATFQYNPKSSAENDEPEASGLLEIHIHNARNIHNICIYDNQDVYAKFSLTYNPDEIISTRIVHGGGKNPEFEQDLELVLRQPRDAVVVKCEIWMLSRDNTYMEDQLLGRDFALSSTDLFHSPAGTVRLTLSLNLSADSEETHPGSGPDDTSLTPELALLDRKASGGSLDLADYNRVEFPDVNAFRENQKMISEYLLNGESSFLHLGAMHAAGEHHHHHHVLTNLPSSTQSDQFPHSGSLEKEGERGRGEEEKKPNCSGKMEVDDEQLAIQKQIVEMYMKSMHQFTESLAKMKLPMELAGNDQTQLENSNKTGSRVFYGSRAFF